MDINKIFSGRFIFTVVTAGVFAFATVKAILNPDKIAEIIMMVIIFYFSRTDRKENGNGTN